MRMLSELCDELHNWFETDKVFGNFEVTGGEITLDFLKPGQYFRIVGSTFNDGVWQYPVSGLTDETFEGAVWPMAVPPAVVALAAEIEAWAGKYADVADSPYTSESFGGYSYTKAGSAGDASATGWRGQYMSRLNRWRKV